MPMVRVSNGGTSEIVIGCHCVNDASFIYLPSALTSQYSKIRALTQSEADAIVPSSQRSGKIYYGTWTSRNADNISDTSTFTTTETSISSLRRTPSTNAYLVFINASNAYGGIKLIK